MAKPDLLIVGGGIIGCSAAALAAERGASVLLVEAQEIAAAASGRNSGVVQHPFDPVLAPLHLATLKMYRELAEARLGFDFPDEPAGLLLLTDDQAAASERVTELHAHEPALEPVLLDSVELQLAEPMLGDGLCAVRLATGYPIPPASATRAMAARASRAGAEMLIGEPAIAVVDGPTVELRDGRRLEAGAVLVAAGPWSAKLLDPTGTWRPIRPTYGVTVQVSLPMTPHGVLEEGAVHTINQPVDDGAPEAGLYTFSLVSAAGVSTVGSTFLGSEPHTADLTAGLLAHGSRFVPALRDVRALRTAVCARPQSVDGHPFVGALPSRDGVFVAAGHGPWGISTGPATAAMAVEAILGFGSVPALLQAGRRL